MTYDQLIRQPHPACADHNQCQAALLLRMTEQAAEALRQTGRTAMSQALWCDHGGHAFSERDPGRQRIKVDGIDPDTEEETVILKDFCGECAEKTGMTAKPRTRTPVALTASAKAAADAEQADDHYVLRDLQAKYDDLIAQVQARTVAGTVDG